jgi:hypothetical protein
LHTVVLPVKQNEKMIMDKKLSLVYMINLEEKSESRQGQKKMSQIIQEYPIEHFLPIEGEPYFLCRVSIFKTAKGFISELDVVQKETFKIFKHVETLYAQDSAEEALNNGVETLARFLSKGKI